MAREPTERFEASFKTWAERPPKTPASEAAGAVLERLARHETVPARRRPDRAWRWANALAALLLASVIVARFSPSLAPTGGLDPRPQEPIAAAPLPEGVLLMWLDAETPLYLTMNRPQAQQGEPSS